MDDPRILVAEHVAVLMGNTDGAEDYPALWPALKALLPGGGRILFESDPFCPRCGHNRDTSSVSTIDLGAGGQLCQMCGASWTEIDAQ